MRAINQGQWGYHLNYNYKNCWGQWYSSQERVGHPFGMKSEMASTFNPRQKF